MITKEYKPPEPAWRRLILRFAAIVLGLLLVETPATAAPPALPGWKLVWHDEFDQALLDPAKWSPCERGRADWNDTMSADPRCLGLTNGTLRLRGFANDRRGPDPSPYLTGGVTSRGKFDFLRGKIVIRARFKCAQGAWPALWMLGTSHNWPRNGEMDLMEHLNFDDFVYQTVHTPYTQSHHRTNAAPSSATAKIQRDDFNTYGVEWDPDQLVFTVNEKPVFTYPRRPEIGPEQWPFDQPFYLILSMQIGGNWVGKPDPKDFPAYMDIDWVRVYQRDNGSKPDSPPPSGQPAHEPERRFPDRPVSHAK